MLCYQIDGGDEMYFDLSKVKSSMFKQEKGDRRTKEAVRRRTK